MCMDKSHIIIKFLNVVSEDMGHIQQSVPPLNTENNTLSSALTKHYLLSPT